MYVEARNKRTGEDTFSSGRVNWRSAIRWLASMRIRMVNIPCLLAAKYDFRVERFDLSSVGGN